MTLAEPVSPSEALALCDCALSPAERRRFRELEDIVSKGLETFIAVASALQEIREARLYRQSYPTFQAYLRDKWAISLSRANQMIRSMQTAQHLVDAGTLSQEQARAYPETLFRPLSRVAPELQTLSWELVKRIEQTPDAALVTKVIGRIREAITQGWQERKSGGNSGGASSTPNSTRNSGQLQQFVRLASRINGWNVKAIAAGDDATTLRRHLKAARELMEFCGRLVVAIERRLTQQPPSPCPAPPVM